MCEVLRKMLVIIIIIKIVLKNKNCMDICSEKLNRIILVLFTQTITGILVFAILIFLRFPARSMSIFISKPLILL